MGKHFFIAGEPRTSSTTAVIVNPYDGSEIAHVFQASPKDIDDAIRSSAKAFAVTSQYSSHERSEILRSIADQILRRRDEFASLISAEAGKPILFARAEVDRAISTFTIAAEESKRITGEAVPLDVTASARGKQGIVNNFPIGVIACITPFNFPLNLVAHKIAPAIASGNSFILKPPPQTPLTSLLLGEVLLNSGFERKGINIIPASNTDAEMLVTDERIAMVSFTGSAKVGWTIKSLAGKKKVVLELGGNAAVFVDSSADIPHAVSRCVLGGFGYAGQVCIKVQRILVHESIAAEFEKQLVDAASRVISGDPTNDKTIVGPMISEHEAQRVESWINEAVKAGARLVIGGKRSGQMVEPTILGNITPGMKVCSEEIIGPVITIEKYTEITEAVERVNKGKYGLQAGIFSNDLHSVQYVYRHLQVGGLIVNEYPTFRVDSMPYGGVKDSGFGREGVRYAMAEMMEMKLLVL
ncbi:MAG: aldehyde dehydrogenase family protein [Bacteroidota bacterium]